MAQYLRFNDEEVKNITNFIEQYFNDITRMMDQQCGLRSGSGYLGDLWWQIGNTKIKERLASVAYQEREVYTLLRNNVNEVLNFLRTQTQEYLEAEQAAALRVETALRFVEELSHSIPPMTY